MVLYFGAVRVNTAVSGAALVFIHTYLGPCTVTETEGVWTSHIKYPRNAPLPIDFSSLGLCPEIVESLVEALFCCVTQDQSSPRFIYPPAFDDPALNILWSKLKAFSTIIYQNLKKA